jgi:hypothetical protein
MSNYDPSLLEKRLLAAALNLTLEEIDARLAKLCQRLGLSDATPEFLRWPIATSILIREQPEFRVGNVRGRKPLQYGKGGGVDYQRALVVAAHKREKSDGESRSRMTNVAIIQSLQDRGHRLFPRTVDFQRLEKSVSEGNRRIKQARAEIEKSELEQVAKEAERARHAKLARRRQRRFDEKLKKLGGPLALALSGDFVATPPKGRRR